MVRLAFNHLQDLQAAPSTGTNKYWAFAKIVLVAFASAVPSVNIETTT
jgi:hypothetical protein